MAGVDQTVFIKVGLVLVSVALFFSSFAVAQEIEAAYEVLDDTAASPNSIEVDYLVNDDVPPPNPSPESYEKLDECTNKISRYFVEQILAGTFINKPLTTKSCIALLLLGYGCHIRLVKFLLSEPEIKLKASEALPKTMQIWQTCASVAPSPV